MLRFLEQNLVHNLDQLKQVNPQTQLGIVLKANAYSHDMLAVAKLSQSYASWYLVSDVKEAESIAKLNLQLPILILYTFTENDLEILKLHPEVRFSIHSLGDLERIINFVKKGKVFRPPIKIHLNLDTGMHCLGVEKESELMDILELLKNNPGAVDLEGVWTHLATADELDSAYYHHQLSKFKLYLEQISNNNFIKLRIIHFQNTAAFIRQDQNHFGLVDFGIPIMARIGLGVYGYYPSLKIKNFARTKNLTLKPVLELVSTIVHLKQLKKDDCISYGCTYKCSEDTLVGIVPIGYADGLARIHSNVTSVKINSTNCRILGRVRMNMFVIDVTKVPVVQIGTEVVILGQNDDEPNMDDQSIERAATLENTINYEILTRLKSS